MTLYTLLCLIRQAFEPAGRVGAAITASKNMTTGIIAFGYNGTNNTDTALKWSISGNTILYTNLVASGDNISARAYVSTGWNKDGDGLNGFVAFGKGATNYNDIYKFSVGDGDIITYTTLTKGGVSSTIPIRSHAQTIQNTDGTKGLFMLGEETVSGNTNATGDIYFYNYNSTNNTIDLEKLGTSGFSASGRTDFAVTGAPKSTENNAFVALVGFGKIDGSAVNDMYLLDYDQRNYLTKKVNLETLSSSLRDEIGGGELLTLKQQDTLGEIESSVEDFVTVVDKRSFTQRTTISKKLTEHPADFEIYDKFTYSGSTLGFGKYARNVAGDDKQGIILKFIGTTNVNNKFEFYKYNILNGAVTYVKLDNTSDLTVGAANRLPLWYRILGDVTGGLIIIKNAGQEVTAYQYEIEDNTIGLRGLGVSGVNSPSYSSSVTNTDYALIEGNATNGVILFRDQNTNPEFWQYRRAANHRLILTKLTMTGDIEINSSGNWKDIEANATAGLWEAPLILGDGVNGIIGFGGGTNGLNTTRGDVFTYAVDTDAQEMEFVKLDRYGGGELVGETEISGVGNGVSGLISWRDKIFNYSVADGIFQVNELEHSVPFGTITDEDGIAREIRGNADRYVVWSPEGTDQEVGVYEYPVTSSGSTGIDNITLSVSAGSIGDKYSMAMTGTLDSGLIYGGHDGSGNTNDFHEYTATDTHISLTALTATGNTLTASANPLMTGDKNLGVIFNGGSFSRYQRSLTTIALSDLTSADTNTVSERTGAFMLGGSNDGIIGLGHDGTNYLSDFYIYTVTGAARVLINPLFTAGSSVSARSSASVVGDRVGGIIFGGYNGTSYLKDAYKYSIVDSQMTITALEVVGDIPARNGAVMIGDRVSGVLFGGNNGSPLSDIYTYQVSSGQISFTASGYLNIAPTSRYDMGAVGNKEKLMVFGGWDGGSTVYNDFITLDTETANYTLKKLPLSKIINTTTGEGLQAGQGITIKDNNCSC